MEAPLVAEEDVFVEEEELGEDETAAIESKNIFMLFGKPDRRLGLKPVRLEVREEDGKPKLEPDVGVEFR